MRRSSVRAFYLAVFALLSEGCTVRAASATSSQTSPDVCAVSSPAEPNSNTFAPKTNHSHFLQFEPKAKVSDACASYAELNKLNDHLHPYVRNLANNTDFFSYYRLNLYNKKCPFWDDENGMCGNRACAVTTVDNEEDVPPIWRALELSKLEGPKAKHPGRRQQREQQRPLMGKLGEDVGESCVVEYDDECDERDYCIPEDESASAKGDYVSLVDNPERFTGYSGEGAHQVWEAIYRENCFSKPRRTGGEASQTGSSAPAIGLKGDRGAAAQAFKQVVKSRDREEAIKSGSPLDTLELEDECIEKRVFHRVISGMHASISTHLCYDYLNQTTGEWGPNVECYKERLHSHPERISNLYFDYALLLRAVGKLRDYLPQYTFCTGDPKQDMRTKDMVTILGLAIPAGPQIFDESVMFRDQTADGLSLKEDFRNRFRNVSRVMDCVGCDKCRLWGKVQTNGFGTALKVLFEFGNGHTGEDKPLLRRTELVALINTLDKISSALKALEHFGAMVSAEVASAPAEAPVATPRSRHESSIPADFSELDELDDFAEYQPAPIHEETLSEAFWSELDNVWTAYKFVLKSWIELPGIISTIIGLEVQRLWNVWLGKPVQARNWALALARKRDEL